jgi:hypothetical protein
MWGSWLNENLQGKPKCSEKTRSTDNSSTTNPACPHTLGSNPGSRPSWRITAWATARSLGPDDGDNANLRNCGLWFSLDAPDLPRLCCIYWPWKLQISRKMLKFTHVVKTQLGMKVLIASKNISAAMLAHRSNGRGYRTYWQQYGVSFLISLDVLY